MPICQLPKSEPCSVTRIKQPQKTATRATRQRLPVPMAWFAVLVATAVSVEAMDYPWPKYSVLPILFSPTDWNISSAEVQEEAASVRSAMIDIQKFYAQAMGGMTFVLDELQVVQGQHAKEGYNIRWNGGNIYTDGVEFTGNMEAAVVEELYTRGYPTPPGQNVDGYSVLIFVKGTGGFAGGREFPASDGGWAIMGDWALDSLQGDVVEGQYWWSGRRLQIGAAAHELGHTFGLPHPDAYNGNWDTTIMGNWWNYPNTGLNQWEIDSINANKAAFFSQPLPEPSTVGLLSLLAPVLGLIRRRGRAHRSRVRPHSVEAGLPHSV